MISGECGSREELLSRSYFEDGEEKWWVSVSGEDKGWLDGGVVKAGVAGCGVGKTSVRVEVKGGERFWELV